MSKETIYHSALFAIMEQQNWGWNLCNLVDAYRPFLVDISERFVGYPCRVGEPIDQILSYLKHDHDGPAENYLLCFDGVPDEQYFTALWHRKMGDDKLSVCWCDTNSRLKWLQNTTAMIGEHHLGGVKGLMDDFLEGDAA